MSRPSYAPTINPVNILIENWDETTDGEKPSKIGFTANAPGAGDRMEFHDETIMIYLEGKAFDQPGVEQYYEREVINYIIIVSTLDDDDRYNQIINAVRRIYLSFTGNKVFSRFHVNDISYEQNVFYRWGRGSLTGYLNIVKRR